MRPHRVPTLPPDPATAGPPRPHLHVEEWRLLPAEALPLSGAFALTRRSLFWMQGAGSQKPL